MWKTHQKFKCQKQLEKKIYTHSEDQMVFILFDILTMKKFITMWKTHQKFKCQKQLEKKIYTHSEDQMVFILFDIGRTH